MEALRNRMKAYFKVDAPGMEDKIVTVDEMSSNLLQQLSDVNNAYENKNLIRQHIERVLEINARNDDKVSDFKPGLEWINVTEPLSLYRHLKGKVVLLDFFTYCCINCLHVLPDLKKLEEEFTVKDGLVVVGVHSAKFSNEKISGNIECAARRYGITHPVVNDCVEGMWTALMIHCWPSFVLLGVEGEVLLSLQGERHYSELRLIIQEALNVYRREERLSLDPVPQIEQFKVPTSSSVLSFPGKVTLTPQGSLIALSDTAHHRILITTRQGEILHEVGGLAAGFRDGSFQESAFNSPQGLCFIDENTVMVADTENHAIRKVDLWRREVSTVAGDGHQGHDYQGGTDKVQLSSPWDVCFVPHLNMLFIAMAGTHQLWAYPFTDCTLWKKHLRGATCVRVVGSGREENRNGRYPDTVGLAQPSGLSYSADLDLLVFADSESSTIRAVSLRDGSTSLLAGGDLNPKDLFAFGDEDGVKMKAKLQHPLDVACHSSGVFVVDSYNHKIKVIDPSSKMCSTLDPSLYKLNEPGGLYCFADTLYIADTNNHCIRLMNIIDKTVSTLEVRRKTGGVGDKRREVKVVGGGEASVAPGATIQVTLELTFPPGCKLNTEVPSSWTIYYPDGELLCEREDCSPFQSWQIENVLTSGRGSIKCRLFLCDGELCSLRELAFDISVLVCQTGANEASIELKHELLSGTRPEK